MPVTISTSLVRGALGEDAADLRLWLHQLTGCPPVTHTLSLRCDHGPSDPGEWFYVEADAAAGVARRRCVSCARVQLLLDSGEHWTFPAMHACHGCGQSLLELAAGVHAPGGGVGDPAGPRADWLALAGRCVACGRIDGLTDLHVPATPLAELALRL